MTAGEPSARDHVVCRCGRRTGRRDADMEYLSEDIECAGCGASHVIVRSGNATRGCWLPKVDG